MKLLIVTQKVDIDDDVLGFFHDWIAEFAKHCEKVTVICLEKGNYDLPSNVVVKSLGKESYKSPLERSTPDSSYNSPLSKGSTPEGGGVQSPSKIIQRLKYLSRYYKLIWKYRKEYDQVFVHMVPMYVNIGWPVWRILRKRIDLWYTHGSVDFNLRLAEKLVKNIFTATKESCRLVSKKIIVVGHGIDCLKFIPKEKPQNGILNIILIGRISPVKKYEDIILAAGLLRKKSINNFQVSIIGKAIKEEDERYLDSLKNKVAELDLNECVNFVGSVSFEEIQKYYQDCDLFVHTSQTGSLDKVLLEAMAMSRITISSNPASKDILSEFGQEYIYKSGDINELAEKIIAVLNMKTEKRNEVGSKLREIIKRDHNMEGLLEKISNIIKK
ncbi:hypothetical protein C0583_03710 [Candidatus Parcubacteria bacterium]|nr:MAG: hypothetical protein C0583_03710 [Candidatus Parcubacteria bacterium]